MFTLEAKAIRHIANSQNYEVVIHEDNFIEFVNTNFGMQYYPKCEEWEVFTNYSKDGQWKVLKNSFNGTYRDCVDKIISMDRYFKKQKDVETHTLIFYNTHAMSTPETFTNIEHARDYYRQERAKKFYTHYKLYVNGEFKKDEKIS